MSFILSFFLFLLIDSNLYSNTKKEIPYTVVISIDGFRNDYTDLLNLSFLKTMRKKGVTNGEMNPVYPSKTFPNHFSMSTGLYPDEHGIIGNIFYQKKSKKLYTIGNIETKKDPSWYQGIPIWTLLEKKGIKTASYFWPVSEAPISGIKPSYLIPWEKKTDGDVPISVRLNQGIKWLSLPEKNRPHLVLLYISQVDSFAHELGPFNKKTIQALRELDTSLENFYTHLKKLPFETNLILCGDHGISEVENENIIYLTDYLKPWNQETLKILGEGSLVHLYVLDEKKLDEIFAELKKKKDSKIEIYKRSEIPSNFHLSKSENTGDIIIYVKSPYYILNKQGDSHKKGDHGYDSSDSNDMKTIYYGFGPDISKQNVFVTKTTDIFFVLKAIYSLN